MLSSWNPAQPEITDLIIQHDPHTLRRLPVRKADLVALFSKFHNRQALRVIRALPENNGVLDDRAIDALFLTVRQNQPGLGNSRPEREPAVGIQSAGTARVLAHSRMDCTSSARVPPQLLFNADAIAFSASGAMTA